MCDPCLDPEYCDALAPDPPDDREPDPAFETDAEVCAVCLGHTEVAGAPCARCDGRGLMVAA